MDNPDYDPFGGWIDRKTAIDVIEPEPDRHDDLRDAALKYTAVINAFGRRIEQGLATGSFAAVATTFWGVAFALGLACVDGRSMTEIASMIGVARATISKNAIAFCHANGLQESFYMKNSEARESYTASRIESIQRKRARP